MKLVVRDQQGQFILTCPTCRQATSVSANGVAGLQSAFQVNHLLEILEKHKKAKDTAASQERAESVRTQTIPSKKVNVNCLEHTDKERELYCETCSDLICIKCAIKGGKHQIHDHYLLDEAFERYKEEISPSLEPLEGKLVAVKEALAQLDKRCGKISNHRVAIEANIHNTIGRLHKILDVRKTELISQLHKMTQRKLKDLAIQRDKMETILAQLSSCLDFVGESLKTGNQGEVLMMKTNIVNQVKELTSPFQPGILEPSEEADMEFSVLQDLIAKCQNYGQILSSGSPDLSKCQAAGKGLEEAVVGEKSTGVVEAVNLEGKSCVKSISSLQCELVSLITGATERGNVEHKGQNRYEISYCPTIKGKHQLHIKVEDTHIRGSPFSVRVKLPVKKLGTPILTIDVVNRPRGVVINQREEVVVTEYDCVSVFSPSGKKLQSFGSRGSGQGRLKFPWGVAVDGEGNIFVVDNDDHCIQKFTASGQFLCAVGTQGKGPLQFHHPIYIAFNTTNNKIYVTDNVNVRVQVLNSDLTFSNTFGRKGNGSGQFRGIRGIACDNTGNVYVVDGDNHRIQVFTADGKFSRMFGCGRWELRDPCGIAIDSNDVVYVSEFSNDRVSMFTSKGQFISSFGVEGVDPGEFKSPWGVAVDSCGVVYVCDTLNNRIQVF